MKWAFKKKKKETKLKKKKKKTVAVWIFFLYVFGIVVNKNLVRKIIMITNNFVNVARPNIYLIYTHDCVIKEIIL